MAEKEQQVSASMESVRDITGLGRSGFIWRLLAALLSAALLSLAFPPVKWDLLAWVAFIPIMVMPTPRTWLERLLIGYAFGYAHFASVLFWLNEVGFGAGWILASYCALFPMLWYLLLSFLNWHLKDKKTLQFPGAGPLFISSEWILALNALFAATLWVSLEFLRGWLFTGFPWDLVGISQFRRVPIIRLSAFGGVYAVSFAILLCNSILSAELTRQIRRMIVPHRRRFPWHLLLGALALFPVGMVGIQSDSLPPENIPHLQAVPVQGNLPLCRFWTEKEFLNALNTYFLLSRQIPESYPNADLVVWPESAIPAPLHFYQEPLKKLSLSVKKTFLIGAIRTVPLEGEESNEFNSAVLVDAGGQPVDYYNKVHRVPFGEYTPFGDQLPWLRKMIGMGRDLTPGREFNLFNGPKKTRLGVNICFEDAFPEISRTFTQKGANLLVTITNDSWYNDSCGAEQHTSHAVFRAVENRRPFLRSGQNSFTCLITPDGRILGQIQAEHSPFVKGFQAYDIPVYEKWGDTFYSKYGDILAYACIALSCLALALLLKNIFDKKTRLLHTIR